MGLVHSKDLELSENVVDRLHLFTITAHVVDSLQSLWSNILFISLFTTTLIILIVIVDKQHLFTRPNTLCLICFSNYTAASKQGGKPWGWLCPVEKDNTTHVKNLPSFAVISFSCEGSFCLWCCRVESDRLHNVEPQKSRSYLDWVWSNVEMFYLVRGAEERWT